MQTFVPEPRSYYSSLSCLDPSRLGNQIYREAKTLISGGWSNHPASKMWRDHIPALALYCLEGIRVLSQERNRDYPNHFEYFYKILSRYNLREIVYPDWWGDENIHSSHRSVLLRKGLHDETFRRFKRFANFDTTSFPKKKSLWLPYHYELYWETHGKPKIEDTWYGQFGWKEEPAILNKNGSLPYVWAI